MKTFASFIALIASMGAIALSSLTFFKVSNIEKQLAEQVALSAAESVPTASPSLIAESRTAETGDLSAGTLPSGATADSTIEPGQFSQSGYDNKAQIEIVSVERLSAAESGEEGIVNVNIRVKRTTDDIVRSSYILRFSDAKGRNPKTNAVYASKPSQTTSGGFLGDLPLEVWADGYFWLKNVPEGVKSLDIVFPETAIFEDVPISG